MNRKNIGKSLNAVLTNWVNTIDDESVVNAIKKDALITGGAIVSLLNGEKPNDYDVYFRTMQSCKLVAEYYAKKWNEEDVGHKRPTVEILVPEDESKVECFIRSVGVAKEDGEDGIDDSSEPAQLMEQPDEEKKEEKPKYRPRYFSTNAISLSDDIQIVIRFFGEVGEIHKNYDFVHCTCSYDWKAKKVDLPSVALEAIINKELIYCGSKYPLCSIIRTRKFITRGYTINAGQYVKMALQLNELDLTNLEVFKDQVTGVDSAYFDQLISAVQGRVDKEDDFVLTSGYLIELIDRFF